jgi:hypothetical protein
MSLLVHRLHLKPEFFGKMPKSRMIKKRLQQQSIQSAIGSAVKE